MSDEGTWVRIEGDTTSARITNAVNHPSPTPWLDRGVLTPRLDAGPQTPGLDSNPFQVMDGFMKDVLAEKEAARRADRAIPNDREKVRSTFHTSPMPASWDAPPKGRNTAPGKSASDIVATASNAFYRIYQDGSDWMLQGGQVAGSVGNVVVADIDIGNVGSEPADGTIYWLEVDGDGTEISGILYGGFEVTGAAAGHGSTMPGNTIPEAGSSSGTFYLMLGVWNDDVFTPSAPGHLNVFFCPPSFLPSRF